MNLADDPHLDVGAHVLNALPAGEAAAFENHLAACSQCRLEAEQLSEAAVGLGAAETNAPSADLRRRVLGQIATVRQDRPVALESRRRRRLRSGLGLALAASVAGAVALGGVAWWQSSEADTAREQSAEVRAGYRDIAGVLAAHDATISTEKLAGGGTASVVASRAEGRAAFIADGLPRLTDDQVYELWFDESGQYRPTGLVSAAGGHQAHLLDGRMERATAVCVTVEPAGGSQHPTTEPIGVISVPA
ncbi:membrane protein [Streptomyces viridochromogenes DSM 40736]|uniref:Regulator of SigK n=1 Tax=Streptomyces viridochromogenes (strain DSM 40736 / JCM 4977 / BCRC 1201 / Tue 494) TaxID=591159 RepID=D9XGF5_STRVT|nr:anti-sigma factor [Streptomyces viridochromogenes]EFL37044.1 membrane protein [Streptomyces viridochromogenes DSM 40736]